MLALTSQLQKAHYTSGSWAAFTTARNLRETTPTDRAKKLQALRAAVNGLIMTDAAQRGVDDLSRTMKRYFDGQNDSALHAMTLSVNPITRIIDVYTFQPNASFFTAMPGTGVKTAFTDPPILSITTQNGTFVPLLDAADNRDTLGAAITIAEAIGVHCGIDAYTDTLGDILALPDSLRSMQFLFGCGPTASHTAPPAYHALFTLRFQPAQLYLASTIFTLPRGGTQQLTAISTLPKPLRWSSSNSSVATVDSRGRVTAVGRGHATITVSAAGYTGYPVQASITVAG